TLQARAGVFGALPLQAVREEQHETREALPFLFGADDKLIDDGLRAVPEVAELRFPKNQAVGPVEAVAVFEAEHAGFAERAVDDLDGRLVGRKVVERAAGLSVLDIAEHGVAVAE